MIRFVTAAFCATALVAPALAKGHPCEADAKARAAALLKLHFESDGVTLAPEPGAPKDGQDGSMMNWDLDATAKVLAPIQALVGKGKFDVLEVNGSIYKATYRMRFIYAQIPDSCVLMGQEILEESDPY
jgi:hypothetical protein